MKLNNAEVAGLTKGQDLTGTAGNFAQPWGWTLNSSIKRAVIITSLLANEYHQFSF